MTESPAVSQERMKRELAAFLREISTDAPLLLFLDDLHWADTSTVDIIVYIATKLSAVQLLAIATYRSSEMLLSKHPFLPVALDLQARGVCQVLPLEFLTAEDVDQYLALEFPNHRFPGQFASLIHTKTEGNPLFMTDVVRYLRDKKVIGEHDGRWALVQTVPEIETDLPASVRSMIQRKIAQLGDADRRLLLAASAQGYAFDSAVVARALALDPGDVEERLQSLDQTHGFVSFREEEELPDHTLTLRYRFVHVLYQNALFETLTPSRRAALSAAVASALLAFYGDDSAEVASELAFLFQAARDWTQASDYFLKAARNAARIFANQEAVSLCQRGLDMNRRTRDAPERARQELKLLMTLGPSLMTVKGFAATDTLRTFLRAQELCEQVGDGVQLFRVLFGLSIVSVVRAEYAKARHFAEQSLQQAERAADAALLVQAHWALGLSLQFIGDFTGSREHLARSLDLYDPKRHAAHAFLYGAILNRMHLGRVLSYLGYPNQAQALTLEGLRVAEQMRHPLGLCNALSIAVTVEAFHRNAARVIDMTDKMLFHADEHGLPYYAGIGSIMRGWARAMQGETDEGCAQMRAGLAAHRTVETEQQRAYYLVLMAEAYSAAGRTVDGLHALDEAVDAVTRSDEHFCEAELYRIKGELLAHDHASEAAEDCLRRAIQIARMQHAKGLELRAATSLARLLRAGHREAARTTLAPICEWFTEGFETPDLQAATIAAQRIAIVPTLLSSQPDRRRLPSTSLPPAHDVTKHQSAEDIRNVAPGHRPALDAEAAGRDRGADGVGGRLGVNQRIRRAELTQPVDVAVADERLAVPIGPALRAAVEVHHVREHRVDFGGVEERRVSVHAPAKAASQRKERVRRHDEPRLALSQPREIVECVDVFGAAAEVQEQDVTTLDRPLDAGNQRQSAFGRIRRQRSHIELTFVQRNRQRAIAQLRRAVDQLDCRMGNAIDRIVCRMGVKLDFQHLPRLPRSISRSSIGHPCTGAARPGSSPNRPSADSSPESQSACGRRRGPSRSTRARIPLCRSRRRGT